MNHHRGGSLCEADPKNMSKNVGINQNQTLQKEPNDRCLQPSLSTRHKGSADGYKDLVKLISEGTMREKQSGKKMSALSLLSPKVSLTDLVDSKTSASSTR